jgi:hypothetical protein
MSIHDRDYVRDKEFDYKKMEYVNNSFSKNVAVDNNGELHFVSDSPIVQKQFVKREYKNSLKNLQRPQMASVPLSVSTPLLFSNFSLVDHIIFPFVIYVFSLLAYVVLSLKFGGVEYPLFLHILIFHIIYLIILFNFYRNR